MTTKVKYPTAPYVDQVDFYGSDSSKIIFRYYQTVSAKDWTKDICGLGVYDYADEKLIDLLPSPQGTCFHDPWVSYDQEWIVFVYQDLSRRSRFRRIARMRTDGTDLEVFAATDTETQKYRPSLSRDGKKVIFTAGEVNSYNGRLAFFDVWQLEIASNTLTRLTNIEAYRMVRAMYMPDDEHFIFSPASHRVYSRPQYERRYIEGTTKKGEPILWYVMNGKTYSEQEFRDIVYDIATNEDDQGLTEYQRKYGDNALFVFPIRGDQTDKQEYDMSKPSINFFDPTKLETITPKDGREPYTVLDTGDNMYYARLVGLNQAGTDIFLAGGGEFRRTNLYRYNLESETLTQITDAPNGTRMKSGWMKVSLDGKRAFVVIEPAIPSYMKKKKAAAVPVPFTVDVETGKETFLNTDTMLDQVSAKLKAMNRPFLPWESRQ